MTAGSRVGELLVPSEEARQDLSGGGVGAKGCNDAKHSEASISTLGDLREAVRILVGHERPMIGPFSIP